MKISILYIFTLLLFQLACSSNQIQQKATLKIPKIKGFDKELIINIKGDSIAAYALIAAGDVKKETIIMIKGYPGNDNNFDLAQQIRANGKNVILFDHRGAWGSQGSYLYSNCLEDIKHLAIYLTEPSISEKLRIDPENLVLIGRSLGGGIALIAGSQIPEVKKIVAISSVNYGDLMKNYTSIDELKRFKSYMVEQIMMNHNIEDFLIELLENKTNYNIVAYKKELEEKEILFIENTSNNKEWNNSISNAEIYTINSDHNYTSHRNVMIKKILNWLQAYD